ncbi:hypothetical protein Taro_042155 [Colocasia esculenta]|uniref:Uncharacterized protein n=1 Tax=Colocasia esculenta TaxID=4460 RepID=A0A843WNR2_COLES|nr:hypothetical protein [Colocasia esculenta]
MCSGGDDGGEKREEKGSDKRGCREELKETTLTCSTSCWPPDNSLFHEAFVGLDIMASLLSKTQLFSSLRCNSQPGQQFLLPRRGFHIELGAREKALLEEDPALKKFKSHKKAVGRVKRIGDALIIFVVAGKVLDHETEHFT